MKPYGHTRHDKQECAYGCCTLKGGKKKGCRKVVDRGRRKRARRISQQEINQEIQ